MTQRSSDLDAVEVDIALAVIDVDGTLLDPGQSIRARVAQAVRAAVQSGCVVSLATSRRFDAAIQLTEQLGIRSPLILQNGAVVQDSGSGQVICEQALQEPLVTAIVEIGFAHRVQPLLFESASCGGGIYCGPPELDGPNLAKYAQVRGPFMRRDEDALATATRALSVGFMAPESDLDELSATLQSLPHVRLERTFLSFYDTPMLTVLPSGVGKGAALRELAKLLNVDLSRTMAVGDGDEDADLLSCVGFGVAMGNASPAAASAARYRTLSNAEDGLALALEEMLGLYA